LSSYKSQWWMRTWCNVNLFWIHLMMTDITSLSMQLVWLGYGNVHFEIILWLQSVLPFLPHCCYCLSWLDPDLSVIDICHAQWKDDLKMPTALERMLQCAITTKCGIPVWSQSSNHGGSIHILTEDQQETLLLLLLHHELGYFSCWLS